jgi:hypothetical protein
MASLTPDYFTPSSIRKVQLQLNGQQTIPFTNQIDTWNITETTISNLSIPVCGGLWPQFLDPLVFLYFGKPMIEVFARVDAIASSALYVSILMDGW